MEYGGIVLARKFLAFLGTTDYKECIYEYDQGEKLCCFTKYTQEAILSIMCKDWTREDTAVIFLTDQAEKENWYNEEKEDRRLKTILEQFNITIKTVRIPEGKKKEEIWEIFDNVIKEIDYKDEIIFDITHAFRSLPMLASVILNYAKVLKNAKILGIYYGAYEAKDKNNIAPIFDLTPLSDILDWSQAVNVFLKYGISGPFKEISVRQLKPHLHREQWARDTKQFVESLNHLTMCLYTCRGKALSGKRTDRKSISSAMESVEDNIKKIKSINEDMQLKPLIPLLEKVEERLEIFNEKDNLSIGIASIKWAVENHLIQQAYTALDETIKTYACEKFAFDSSDANDREKIIQKALKIKALHIPEEKWNVGNEYRNQVKEIVEKLDDQLAILSDKVGKLRNDINHFGFNSNASDYTNLENKVKEYFNEFLNYVNSNLHKMENVHAVYHRI